MSVGSKVVLLGLSDEDAVWNLQVVTVLYIGVVVAGIQLESGHADEVNLRNLADAIFGLPFDVHIVKQGAIKVRNVFPRSAVLAGWS